MARKILLADDSVTAQNMGRKILADAGYEVITVNNGSAALKKISEQKPDLIVLDVYMPGYSGLEVCQRLKEAQESSRIPILLTVGKLEPFKPEEAKRARADAFIVKPFEASELLSALSKLEDRIVPRPEASKPGRFARAAAALDEAYDKTVAIDEDSGWKSRISFPKKKKAEGKQKQDVDDPALYNPVNKDVRMFVERQQADMPQDVQAQEAARTDDARVDLGALVPEGLPRDVTPEEIAALAAAAAQVKGKFANDKVAKPAEIKTAEHTSVEAKSVEISEAKTPEAGTDQKPEATEEGRAESVAAAAPPQATFAESKLLAEKEEKVEAPSNHPVEAAKSSEAPAPADAMVALVGSGAGSDKSSPDSERGSYAQAGADYSAPEPLTMAVAAGATSGGAAPRWTAVAVALAPEEASISLEQEMQKASAAFAAAEGHAAAVASAQAQAAFAEPAVEKASPVAEVAAEPFVPAPAIPAPEPAQPSDATAATETEALSAAVKEFEKVTGVQLEDEKVSAPALAEPAPAETAEALPYAAPEVAQAVEAKAAEAKIEVPAAEAAAPGPETAQGIAAPNNAPESIREEAHHAVPRIEEPESEDAEKQASKTEESQSQESKREELRTKISEIEESEIEETKAEEPAPLAAVAAPAEETFAAGSEKSEPAAPALQNEIPADHRAASSVFSGMATLVSDDFAGGIGDMAKKESEMAASTAAAWASWRRIRESGDAKAKAGESSPNEAAEEAPKDAAAMAVAAGAEKAPETSPSAEESEEIASIVDSVLADLRPKIVEEISRKMGKKKK